MNTFRPTVMKSMFNILSFRNDSHSKEFFEVCWATWKDHCNLLDPSRTPFFFHDTTHNYPRASRAIQRTPMWGMVWRGVQSNRRKEQQYSVLLYRTPARGNCTNDNLRQPLAPIKCQPAQTQPAGSIECQPAQPKDDMHHASLGQPAQRKGGGKHGHSPPPGPPTLSSITIMSRARL